MNFLRDAMVAVQRNLAVALSYVAFFTVLTVVAMGLDRLVFGATPPQDQTLSAGMQTYDLAKQLVVVVLQAVVQAVVFARMGKEIDRPLWRNADDWTAIKRFFNVWLTLGLIETALIQFAGIAGRAESGSAGLFFLLYVLVTLVKIPIGACVMFSGAFQPSQLGKDLAPLGALLPKLGLLVLVNIFVLFLAVRGFSMPDSNMQYLLLPLIAVISSYAECVVFAGAWLMCIEYRSNSDDVDFDF